MDKPTVVARIIEQLRGEFETRSRASKATRDGGNDAESKATSKYDTLAIEENYLADGLAKQAQAAAEAIADLEMLPLRAFANDDPIDLGALVELEFPSAKEWFFLAPSGGGTEIPYGKTTVTVITPESPLGAQLLTAKIGHLTTSPVAKIVRIV